MPKASSYLARIASQPADRTPLARPPRQLWQQRNEIEPVSSLPEHAGRVVVPPATGKPRMAGVVDGPEMAMPMPENVNRMDSPTGEGLPVKPSPIGETRRDAPPPAPAPASPQPDMATGAPGLPPDSRPAQQTGALSDRGNVANRIVRPEASGMTASGTGNATPIGPQTAQPQSIAGNATSGRPAPPSVWFDARPGNVPERAPLSYGLRQETEITHLAQAGEAAPDDIARDNRPRSTGGRGDAPPLHGERSANAYVVPGAARPQSDWGNPAGGHPDRSLTARRTADVDSPAQERFTANDARQTRDLPPQRLIPSAPQRNAPAPGTAPQAMTQTVEIGSIDVRIVTPPPAPVTHAATPPDRAPQGPLARGFVTAYGLRQR
jgi:hypothetical protein